MNPMQMGAKAKGDPIADQWQTPPEILDAVRAFYGGEFFDPCPAKPDFDGLAVKWQPNAFINPPFSQYKQWSWHGKFQPRPQIWLCNQNHDTEWYDNLITGASALCLLMDRVVFIDPRTGKPAADKNGRPQTAIGKCQTLVYAGDDVKGFYEHFRPLGKIVEVLL